MTDQKSNLCKKHFPKLDQLIQKIGNKKNNEGPYHNIIHKIRDQKNNILNLDKNKFLLSNLYTFRYYYNYKNTNRLEILNHQRSVQIQTSDNILKLSCPLKHHQIFFQNPNSKKTYYIHKDDKNSPTQLFSFFFHGHFISFDQNFLIQKIDNSPFDGMKPSSPYINFSDRIKFKIPDILFQLPDVEKTSHENLKLFYSIYEENFYLQFSHMNLYILDNYVYILINGTKYIFNEHLSSVTTDYLTTSIVKYPILEHDLFFLFFNIEINDISVDSGNLLDDGTLYNKLKPINDIISRDDDKIYLYFEGRFLQIEIFPSDEELTLFYFYINDAMIMIDKKYMILDFYRIKNQPFFIKNQPFLTNNDSEYFNYGILRLSDNNECSFVERQKSTFTNNHFENNQPLYLENGLFDRNFDNYWYSTVFPPPGHDIQFSYFSYFREDILMINHFFYNKFNDILSNLSSGNLDFEGRFLKTFDEIIKNKKDIFFSFFLDIDDSKEGICDDLTFFRKVIIFTFSNYCFRNSIHIVKPTPTTDRAMRGMYGDIYNIFTEKFSTLKFKFRTLSKIEKIKLNDFIKKNYDKCFLQEYSNFISGEYYFGNDGLNPDLVTIDTETINILKKKNIYFLSPIFDEEKNPLLLTYQNTTRYRNTSSGSRGGDGGGDGDGGGGEGGGIGGGEGGGIGGNRDDINRDKYLPLLNTPFETSNPLSTGDITYNNISSRNRERSSPSYDPPSYDSLVEGRKKSSQNDNRRRNTKTGNDIVTLNRINPPYSLDTNVRLLTPEQNEDLRKKFINLMHEIANNDNNDNFAIIYTDQKNSLDFKVIYIDHKWENPAESSWIEKRASPKNWQLIDGMDDTKLIIPSQTNKCTDISNFCKTIKQNHNTKEDQDDKFSNLYDMIRQTLLKLNEKYKETYWVYTYGLKVSFLHICFAPQQTGINLRNLLIKSDKNRNRSSSSYNPPSYQNVTGSRNSSRNDGGRRNTKTGNDIVISFRCVANPEIYSIKMSTNNTIEDLKNEIQKITDVKPSKQKLLDAGKDIFEVQQNNKKIKHTNITSTKTYMLYVPVSVKRDSNENYSLKRTRQNLSFNFRPSSGEPGKRGRGNSTLKKFYIDVICELYEKPIIHRILLNENNTIEDLKKEIQKITDIEPSDQRLLKNGKNYFKNVKDNDFVKNTDIEPKNSYKVFTGLRLVRKKK